VGTYFLHEMETKGLVFFILTTNYRLCFFYQDTQAKKHWYDGRKFWQNCHFFFSHLIFQKKEETTENGDHDEL